MGLGRQGPRSIWHRLVRIWHACIGHDKNKGRRCLLPCLFQPCSKEHTASWQSSALSLLGRHISATSYSLPTDRFFDSAILGSPTKRGHSVKLVFFFLKKKIPGRNSTPDIQKPPSLSSDYHRLAWHPSVCHHSTSTYPHPHLTPPTIKVLVLGPPASALASQRSANHVAQATLK